MPTNCVIVVITNVGKDNDNRARRRLMTATPNLTRDIGQAERAMRALLERLLDEAGLSFAEWTVLVFLDGAGPLTTGELVRRQVGGRVAPEAGARAAVDRLLSRGLLAPANDTRGAGRLGGEDGNLKLTPTTAGEAVYLPVRINVERITGELYGDLPQAALEATHRTLAEVFRRADARLVAGG
jgi:DNA-binding MarR family transcriptional regulator